MSDRDGKGSVNYLSEKDNHQLRRAKRKPAGHEFAQAVAKVAVAQICESVGYQGFQQSALDSLADIAIRYIREVGKVACSCANLANRSQCNVFDVIQGLEDLGSIQGFPSASDIGHSLSQSGVVRDMIRYVGKAEEIPFAYSIPSFPVVKKRKLDPSFAQAKENPPNDHVPAWLPKFPDPKSYEAISGKGKDAHVAEPINDSEQPDENCRNLEAPLLYLQQKLLCNGSKAEGAFEEGNTAKTQHTVESNPFLAPPLPFEEKEVSLPVIPAKLLDEDVGCHQRREVTVNHLSNSEPSLQANETERIDPSESDDWRKVLINGRPSVHFKFGNANKHFGKVTSNRNEKADKLSLWFGNDQDGRDEKKMKAEKILLENMENPPQASPL